MGILSHLLTFGAGVYVGTRIYTSGNGGDASGEPWMKVNTSGVKIGSRDVVKITDDKVDVMNGLVHFDLPNRNK
jgi:hypothetical protein